MHVPERFQFLLPFECDLVRVGSSGDGGYVVPLSSLENASSLISLGIASEWSFDSDFLQRRKGISYLACDRGSGFLVHSFSALRGFLHNPLGHHRAAVASLRIAFRFLRLVPPIAAKRRRYFARKWVRATVRDMRRDTTVSELLSVLNLERGIFVKMDIEGGEYEVLPQMMQIERDKPGTFMGLVVEFHDICDKEVVFTRVVKEIQSVFAIAHIHVNNCVPVSADFPSVIELSFTLRDLVGPGRVTKFPLDNLDFPNDPLLPDVFLTFQSSQ